MYLKLIMLLVGLKLCHTANETVTSSIENDDKLFDLLREQGKNYTNNGSLFSTEMYQNDSPNNADEWDKLLAGLHSNDDSQLTEVYQNDVPNLQTENETSKFTSEETIDDDLQYLISLAESNDSAFTDDALDDTELTVDWDEVIITTENDQPLKDLEVDDLGIITTEQPETRSSAKNKRHQVDEPNNLDALSYDVSGSNADSNARFDDEVITTTENDHPLKLDLFTTEQPESSEESSEEFESAPYDQWSMPDNLDVIPTEQLEIESNANDNEINEPKNLDRSSDDGSNSNGASQVIESSNEKLETSETKRKVVTFSEDGTESKIDANNNNITHIVRLDDILNETIDLKNKFPNLYGKHANNQRSLAFVFDSTGSMWDDLQQLKEGAEKIMTAMEERDDNPIYNYILVPFHDPKVGPVTVTKDKELFRRKLEEIDVYGGGDCPEMSLGGISLAIDVSLPRSYIYVLTDATAADHVLVGSILDKVLQKQIQVVFVLTGDCGNRTIPEYTVYEKIAAASSGQVFHLNRSDVTQVLDFVRKTLDSRRENLLVVTNVSPTNVSPHKVAIDSSLDQFTISVSGTNPKIDVVNPEGEHINEPPKVEKILNLDNIQVLNINNPSNGSWEINVSSGSDHSIRLSGLTDLRIDHGFSVNVPKNMDETNHRPLHGQNTYLLLKPSNNAIVGHIASVDLIGLNGQPLRHNIPLSLLPGTTDTYISENFKPPVSFFNLFMKGEDKNGNPFVRLTDTAIKTQFPEKPFVSVKASEVYHLIHVPLNLSCHVETLVPATVQWFKNGKAVSDRLIKKQTGWFHWSDMYPNIYTAGLYTCKVENEAGTNEENILLHMIEPPDVKKPYKLVESLRPGSAFSADCYALAGIPSPSIEWMKNEKIITTDSGINILSNGTLSIPYVTSDHEGLYQCVAANSAGVDTYNLNIRVEVAPSFSIDSEANKTATIKEFVGKSMELHCQANGVPKPVITWLQDGIKLNPTDEFQLFDDNTTLIIPKLALNHEGLFTCIAFNRVGSVNKSISISVLVLPTIQSPDIDDAIQVIEGNEVLLPCLVFGKPKPTVSWIINSTSYDATSDNTNMSFVANVNDSGRYECRAQNAYGSDSRVWYLDVFTRPIIEPPFNEIIEIVENASLELECRTTGHPKPNLNWIADKFLTENETLTIIGKRTEPLVNYTCIAENSAGIVNKTFTVIVKAPPILLTEHYNSINILENKTLVMPCQAEGNPIPSITWYLNDQIITNESSFVMSADNSLSISSIIRNFSGIYKCEAINSEGVDFLVNNVTVLVPPEALDSVNNNIEVIEGKSVQIECPITDSFPPPTVKWFQNGNSVENTLVPKNYTKNNLLFIQTTTIADDGIYICIATNMAGTTEAQIYLTVLYRPRIKNKQNTPIRIKKHTGDVVQLKCEADGNPVPKTQWLRNSMVISNDSSTLSIDQLDLNDRDNYTCQASNRIGRDQNVYFLDVLEPPKIQGPGQEQFDVVRGHTSVLMCQVTGYPQPEIVWSKSSTDIPLEQLGIEIVDNNLKILSMDYQHQGNYKCKAKNTEGISTKSINIKIKVEPTITVTPENKTIAVKENEKFILECIVEGIPKPELHWDKDGVELTIENFQREFTARSSPIQSNLTRYTLIARNVTAALSGKYHCNASNTLGRSSSEFYVTIMTPPKLKLGTNRQNNSIEAIENSPATFVCNVDLGNPPAKITWYKNNKKLTNYTKIRLESNGTVLKILDTNIGDSGTYSCNASNSIGKIGQSFKFDVLVPPKTESDSQVPIDVVFGDDLKLYCDISGHPKPSIMWLKESSPIEEVNSTAELLILPKVSTTDSGEYTCVALNKAGTSKMSFNVKVLEPPKFLDTSPAELNINASIKHGFVLRCDIGGNPQPNITWEKEGRPLFNRLDNKTYHISSDRTNLQITNPKITDAGKYLCEAQNSVGMLRRQFNVFLKVMAEWNPWSEWSECSVTCGEGVRKRSRSCNHPEEFENRTIAIDLSACKGQTSEFQSCVQYPCAIDGGLSDWTGWTSCSATCGSGVQYRYRYCDHPLPAYGGANCSGPTIDQTVCNDSPCPTDGDWSKWSDWGSCTTTCGYGVRFRSRECDSPKPEYGGKDCEGNDMETMECSQEPCPVNGGWSDWTGWTSCSATCGSGVKYRYRYCNYPLPAYGGTNCSGPTIEQTVCNDRPCPKDGNWSHWSGWSSCTTTCGYGVRFRSRECDSPKPEYGGKDCEGNDMETMDCSQEPCPVNGGWTDWEPWSPCSATCALGRKVRKRHCTNPIPQYGGKKCMGEALMFQGCVTRPCFDDPIEYSIYSNVSGIPISNHRVSAHTSSEGSTKIFRFKSFEEYQRNRTKDSWLPYLVFLVSPTSMNMVMLENEDLSTEINDDHDYDLDDDGNDFEQTSKVSFQTGQEVEIRQQARKNLDNGIMEVTIVMNGEMPIVQSESKLIIDPFTENSIPTSKTTRQTSANNYMTIDGKPIKYSWNSEIKHKNRPQLRKLMVEKISAENIAANYDPRKRELNLMMTTNIEDDLDCPKGFETDRSRNICVDVDECAKNLCHSSQICENTVGSYKCSCPNGYKSLRNGNRCLDINECTLETHKCSHYCKNLPGRYICDCPDGMILRDDRHTCIASQRRNRVNRNRNEYINPRNFMDEFINDYPNNYSNEMDYPISDFTFLNTSEECPTGFYHENSECLDINECFPDDPSICSKAHTCLNTKGSYLCLPAPCPEYTKRDIRTNSCVQYCNGTANNAAICSENAEIAQTITYKTLSIMEKDIVPGDPLMELDMETFGKKLKYLSYILQDSTSEVFKVFSTGRGPGILTCYGLPEKSRVHRLIAIGNAYKNAKKTRLLSTTKYIIHVYVFD